MPITTQATPIASNEETCKTPRLHGAVAIGTGDARPKRMVRLTVNLPSDLVEQMRDAVYWTPGLTLAWMIARAVCASLAELTSAHQGPFPRRPKPLRAGRPRLLGQSMKIQAPSIGQAGRTLSEGGAKILIVSNTHVK